MNCRSGFTGTPDRRDGLRSRPSPFGAQFMLYDDRFAADRG